MAYFSNGSEGMIFDAECADCKYGEDPCPIAWVQMEYNYKACNNEVARDILNGLVKQDKDFKYLGCQMKNLIEEKEKNET